MISLAKPKDFCVAVVLLIVSGVLYAETIPLSQSISHALGPAFFPRILIFLIAFLSIVLIVQSFRKRPQGAEADAGAACPAAPKDPQEKFAERRKTLFMQFVFVVLLLAYLVLLPVLSYVPCTLLFLFVSMLFLGARTKKRVAIYAVVSVVVTYGLQFIFGTMLHLFLP
ncbi:tripartite tricarboxylate transporter TctB family protein [Desulfocurvus sp. DL9XJH121]